MGPTAKVEKPAPRQPDQLDSDPEEKAWTGSACVSSAVFSTGLGNRAGLLLVRENAARGMQLSPD